MESERCNMRAQEKDEEHIAKNKCTLLFEDVTSTMHLFIKANLSLNDTSAIKKM